MNGGYIWGLQNDVHVRSDGFRAVTVDVFDFCRFLRFHFRIVYTLVYFIGIRWGKNYTTRPESSRKFKKHIWKKPAFSSRNNSGRNNSGIIWSFLNFLFYSIIASAQFWCVYMFELSVLLDCFCTVFTLRDSAIGCVRYWIKTLVWTGMMGSRWK